MNDAVDVLTLGVTAVKGAIPLLDSGKYVVPLYQREFAWGSDCRAGRDEISQLIVDLKDCPPDRNYYLGSLVVHRRSDGVFEVIDGQQRLTAIVLLYASLRWVLGERDVPSVGNKFLSYDCRVKSNFTLMKLAQAKDLFEIEVLLGNGEPMDVRMINGLKTIRDSLGEGDRSKKAHALLDALKRVRIYRVEVPHETDLNRYFEIMNTRGEQLLPTDIVKARLMSKLSRAPRARELFAAIWSACSQMDGYVQMHMAMTLRKGILCLDWMNWNGQTGSDWVDFVQDRACLSDGNAKDGDVKTFWKRVLNGEKLKEDTGAYDGQRRFASIIEFPYFLLHVLRIFCKDGQDGKYRMSLDDKMLIRTFEGETRGWDATKVMQFITCVLHCRFLFDNLIIKREYLEEEDTTGTWSLKRLVKYDGGTTDYVNFFTEEVKDEVKDEETTLKLNQVLLMLQSCLRVSYTEPKSMNWITFVLKFLRDKTLGRNFDFNKTCGVELARNMEGLLSDASKDFCKDEDYAKGVDTPHVVLNFLDYCLWRNEARGGVRDFVFEYRNSVEHWYPRNPEERSWEEDGYGSVDRFGNLCLLQRDINSKFSNKMPMSKCNDHDDMINKGSLKLRKMRDITRQCGDANWRKEKCAEHERDMLGILRRACGLKSVEGASSL